MKDPRLGPRRADVTHWRCRRLEDETDKKGAPLFFAEADDGFEGPEWPIRSCSPETIVERWGPGRYVVDYVQIDASGRCRPRAHSRVLNATGKAVKAPDADGAAKIAAAPTALATLPPVAAPMDPSVYTHVLSMLTFLEDRNEKARATAAAEARYAIERAAAEAKNAQERYRADAELQIERERLASKERIAQIEASRGAPGRGSRFDAEELSRKIDAVAERVDEALERIEEGPSSAMVRAPDAPDNNTAAIVSALKDTLAPILSIVVTKLAAGPTLPDTGLPPVGGTGTGGDDPKGEPN